MSEKGKFPVINGGIEPSGYIEKCNENSNTITMSQGGASAGFVNFQKTKFWAGAHCYVISTKNNSILINRYLYHILKHKEKYFQTSQQGAGIPSVNRNVINSIEIVLPSLSDQQRIVDTLDKFEAMVENVEKELNLRQKQYEYYRQVMIASCKPECLNKYVILVKDRISASELNADNYISVENLIKDKGGKTTSDSVPTSGNWTRYETGDILIGNIRPYLRKIWMADRCGGTNGDVIVLRSKDKEKYTPKYLYETLADDAFFLFYNTTVKEGKMPRGNKDKVFDYEVSMPMPDVQQQIVSKLDHFESLIANLKQELELRKKQYEYYREKLLTF